jgi:hypothetical protein
MKNESTKDSDRLIGNGICLAFVSAVTGSGAAVALANVGRAPDIFLAAALGVTFAMSAVQTGVYAVNYFSEGLSLKHSLSPNNS